MCLKVGSACHGERAESVVLFSSFLRASSEVETWEIHRQARDSFPKVIILFSARLWSSGISRARVSDSVEVLEQAATLGLFADSHQQKSSPLTLRSTTLAGPSTRPKLRDATWNALVPRIILYPVGRSLLQSPWGAPDFPPQSISLTSNPMT